MVWWFVVADLGVVRQSAREGLSLMPCVDLSLMDCVDLCIQLKELKAELAALRVAKVTGGAPNKLSKMYGDFLFALVD